jgi:hypothetical protein
MSLKFVLEPGPRGLCVRSWGCSLEVCLFVHRLVLIHESRTPESDKLVQEARPLLMGYGEPRAALPGFGWVHVEFGTEDRAAIDALVAYLNQEVGKLG